MDAEERLILGAIQSVLATHFPAEEPGKIAAATTAITAEVMEVVRLRFVDAGTSLNNPRYMGCCV